MIFLDLSCQYSSILVQIQGRILCLPNRSLLCVLGQPSSQFFDLDDAKAWLLQHGGLSMQHDVRVPSLLVLDYYVLPTLNEVT